MPAFLLRVGVSRLTLIVPKIIIAFFLPPMGLLITSLIIILALMNESIPGVPQGERLLAPSIWKNESNVRTPRLPLA